MRLSKSPSPRRRRPAAVDVLEARQMMTATTITATSQEQATTIPSILATVSGMTASSSTVTLDNYFSDPNVPGTLVTMDTSKGNIVLSLTDTATPNTVANFLSYVTSGAYDDTIFHRSANLASSSTTISATNPATIIQGGGYTVGTNGLVPIATNAPVDDEYTNEEYGDIQGTIAMAKTSSANSATSEWYFNVSDNTSLDTPTTDSNGNTTSYTVFGKVLSGMDVIDTIASLPIANITTSDGSTTPAPITGLTQTQITDNVGIGADNLVYVYSVTEEAGTTYTVSSTNQSLVTPTITNGVLSFKYDTAGATGTAVISVTATNVYDQTTASTSFAVTVPPASSTVTGPVTTATTVAAAVAGQPNLIHPLSGDTDASAALNPTTVTITTQPAHGTATVDSVSGDITYTPQAAYVGTDTINYTVTDGNGTVSSPAAVNVTVIAAPQTINIGKGYAPKSIVYTQPDGAKAQLTLTTGSAAVTFNSGTITATDKGGVETVSGAGATITNVVVTNNVAANGPTVSLVRVGRAVGTITFGGLTDAAAMIGLNLADVTLTGTVSIAGLNTLEVGVATDAVLDIGSAAIGTKATIGTAVDTSMTVGVLRTLTAKQWKVDNGGSYVLNASAIQTMTIPGTFDDVLEVTSGSGYSITRATVGDATATWFVNGGIFDANVTVPAATSTSTSSWSLEDGSLIRSLTVHGTLTGTVFASAIDNMTVTGGMSGATVQTDGLFNQKVVQLQHLTVDKAMTNSVVEAAGNIGTVSASSMSGSKVFAGVLSSVESTTTLPSATTDLSAEATISSVFLRAPTATFANSEIAAYKVGSAHLGTVTAANGGTAFGLSAHTLGGVSAILDPGGRLALSPAQLKSASVLSSYLTKKKITLSDFAITLY